MHTSVEGKHVMFAERIKIDVLDDNHLIATFLVKDCALQYGNGVLLIASGKVSHGSGHAQRSPQQPLPRRVLAQQLQYSRNMLLYLFLHRSQQVLLF